MRKPRPTNITFSLDPESSVPLHEQIYLKLRDAVRTGVLVEGDRIPSVRRLSHELGVSHITVEQAYLELSVEGYVRAVPRSGYVVEHVDTAFFEAEREDVWARVSKVVTAGTATGLVAEDQVGSAVRFDFSYVNLRPGSFPQRAWQKACQEVSLGPGDPFERYGYHGHTGSLQREIARYLRQARGVVCEPEQVILEPGSQVAVSELFQLFDPSSQTVGVEEPGWQVARTTAERLGFRTVPLAVGEAGPRMAANLREADPSIAFLTPSHQFPTGVVLPLQSRVEALEWARERNSYVIEDDSCSEYRYDMRPVPSLQSLDTGLRTVYLGNFSKTLSPALRVAYLVLPPDLLERYLQTFPSGHPGVSTYEAEALAQFMASGQYERQLRRMVADNRKCHDELLRCLTDRFGDMMDIRGKHSGMHLYVTVKNGMGTDELIATALKCDAKVYSTERFWFSRPAPEGVVMLGFSALALEDIAPAVDALAKAWL